MDARPPGWRAGLQPDRGVLRRRPGRREPDRDDDPAHREAEGEMHPCPRRFRCRLPIRPTPLPPLVRPGPPSVPPHLRTLTHHPHPLPVPPVPVPICACAVCAGHALLFRRAYTPKSTATKRAATASSSSRETRPSPSWLQYVAAAARGRRCRRPCRSRCRRRASAAGPAWPRSSRPSRPPRAAARAAPRPRAASRPARTPRRRPAGRSPRTTRNGRRRRARRPPRRRPARQRHGRRGRGAHGERVRAGDGVAVGGDHLVGDRVGAVRQAGAQLHPVGVGAAVRGPCRC